MYNVRTLLFWSISQPSDQPLPASTRPFLPPPRRTPAFPFRHRCRAALSYSVASGILPAYCCPWLLQINTRGRRHRHQIKRLAVIQAFTCLPSLQPTSSCTCNSRRVAAVIRVPHATVSMTGSLIDSFDSVLSNAGVIIAPRPTNGADSGGDKKKNCCGRARFDDVTAAHYVRRGYVGLTTP
jgi:hypothetical protein